MFDWIYGQKLCQNLRRFPLMSQPAIRQHDGVFGVACG